MRLRCESEESCGTEQESSTYEEESELLYATTLLCDTFRSRRRPLEASNPLQRRPSRPKRAPRCWLLFGSGGGTRDRAGNIVESWLAPSSLVQHAKYYMA